MHRPNLPLASVLCSVYISLVLKKTFKYRLRLTAKQRSVLSVQLEVCRRLYNHLLSERIQAYEDRGESLSRYDQIKRLPLLKQDRPSLTQVNAQVLQNVAVRVDWAFKAFYRRYKKPGETPGFPRFKGQGRYDSFTYPQAKDAFRLDAKGLRLSKIGCLRVVQHRPLEGTPKTATLHRSSTGKWHVSLVCDVEAAPLPPTGEAVGIDVGLEKFATLSTGEIVDNPRFLRSDEKKLAKANRRLAKATKGTPQREKVRKILGRIHERIAYCRHNFAHQEARKVVNRFDVIAIEDLKVNAMVQNRCLSKGIADAAWSKFRQVLSYKAEEAGRTLVAVNPAYTSQDCSDCGHRLKKALSVRRHVCPCCGLDINRDENAARNILRLGTQSAAA